MTSISHKHISLLKTCQEDIATTVTQEKEIHGFSSGLSKGWKRTDQQTTKCQIISCRNEKNNSDRCGRR